jgi:hypothetical protein
MSHLLLLLLLLLLLTPAGHSRGAINATLYSGQPAQAQQQQQQQQQHEQTADPSSSSSGSSHHVPLVVLVAGRYDLTLNMHQRYGHDVVKQLQESGPQKQVTKRDKDRHEIEWELDAQVRGHLLIADSAGRTCHGPRVTPLWGGGRVQQQQQQPVPAICIQVGRVLF